MQKNKSISSPKVGMNRATSSHLLSEGEFSFQKNGNSYDEGGEKFNLTDEHSNILAVVFPEGYKVIGVKNHIVRDNTYVFLTNPETGCSEIGLVKNTTDYTFEEDVEVEGKCKTCTDYSNTEATPLEEQIQAPHQEYTALLQDCCSLEEDSHTKCLNFNIDHPIVDIIIKEENIGTSIFWTDSPGNNELRYLQLDDLGQYITSGQDACGAIPEDTCLDCTKLRVFKLHENLKIKDYNRTLGGNLTKGSYEVLGAYCDQLGNEYTGYTTLTPIIPIFDEANIVHEQDQDNAETNFAIKVELDTVDDVFDYYKIAVRYYTSKGVFSSFIEGVHETIDKTIFVSRNTGQSISNTKLSIQKPTIETVDGIAASNNILFLNGVKEREPFNLQPVINIAGLGVKWMSYRAKESLYSQANSYKYIGYNRDENIALAVDFGLKEGGRTNLYHFIPRPPTEEEVEEVVVEGVPINEDIASIISIVKNCDLNDRTQRWQYYNTAGEGTPCSVGDLDTVEQTEAITVYTEVTGEKGDEGNLLPQIPSGEIVLEEDLESFTSLIEYIEDNRDFCTNANSPLNDICDFIHKDSSGVVQAQNTPNLEDSDECSEAVEDPSEARIEVVSVEGEIEINTNKALEDYVRTRTSDTCTITEEDEIDTDFSDQYALDLGDFTQDGKVTTEDYVLKRSGVTHAEVPNSAVSLNPDPLGGVSYVSFVHPYSGAVQPDAATTREEQYASMQTDYLAPSYSIKEFTQDEVGGIGNLSGYNEGAMFTSKIHKGAIWTKIDVSAGEPLLVEISKLTENGGSYWRLGNQGSFKIPRFKNRNIRVTFFYNKSNFTPIETTNYPNIDDITGSTSIQLGGIFSLTSYPELIPLNSEIVNHPDIKGGIIYMAIDVPLSDAVGLGENTFTDEEPSPTASDVVPTVVTVPLNSCFSVNTRKVEYARKEITFDSISIKKIQKWEYECTYEIPVIDDCKPVPYEVGELGYYKSTEEYPDNEELYDSSKLVLDKGSITNSELKSRIEGYYKSSEDKDNIYLSEEADFRCKSIRHYKLPDNKKSPFINTNTLAASTESIISPLGFTLDGEVIENMLTVAVQNELITEEQRESIQDYKIYRSDSELDRSVVSSGLVYNTKEYTKDNEVVNYLNYPYNTLGEDKFFEGNTHSDDDDSFTNMQVLSPEFDYFRPFLPDEATVQGYMFGKSRSRVSEVEDHAKMVILGSKARRLANTLAVLETISESILNVAQSAESYRVQFGLANSLNPVGIALNIALFVSETVSAIVYKVGRYRLEWLQSFENLGTPHNFGYYLTSVGNYNNLKPLQEEGDSIRGLSLKTYLKQGQLEMTDPTNGDAIKINNIDREEGAFFTLGDYPIEVPIQYKNYDNNDINSTSSSQMISSEIGSQSGKSPEKTRNIASPYVAFKNYTPNQYGNIGSIRWVDTGYCFDITSTGECEGVLGGDTFISRHSKKRKARIFDTDLLGSADLTPFPYNFYGNYGNPTYYIDYKVNSTFESGGELFPDIFYDVEFDGLSSTNTFYVEPPGKFYLYTTSFPTFLCETRINTNFRNARAEPWNQFYPQNSDYERITQPKLVPLTTPENFYYNKAYLQTKVLNTNQTLPEYYSAEDESKKAYNTNTIQYSLPDTNENSITEPWLLYRPNDKVTLESTYGNLVNIKGIESDQLLMFFEDALQLQNSVNTFTDGSTQYNTDLGNGGVFAKRALTLRHTDLGYGGSQTKHTLSCEFGHFYTDTKRGQVFKFTGGNDLQEISRYANGKPNGMDIWFKEHLPIKFKKQFPTFEQGDNPYNGVGVHWGYDSKYRRVILTKKDYVKAEGVEFTYDNTLEEFSNGLTLQENISAGNLKDISWTITFKPETGSWESYMSYVPNYYISHTDYFQSGINSEDDENGLWSHLLSNKSYRVFYGQKYPYVIEYPVKNEYFSKRLESIDWNAQLRRYHNEYDFAPIETTPFTSVTIFNDYENSGELIPVKNTGALSQLSKYPITNKNNTQDVLLSYDNYRYTMNYFFNRVKSNKNNQPVWQWDENQIEKSINSKAVSFYGKKSLERLKGNFFTVRLERDGNTNYDLDFRWSEQVTKGIQ